MESGKETKTIIYLDYTSSGDFGSCISYSPWKRGAENKMSEH